MQRGVSQRDSSDKGTCQGVMDCGASRNDEKCIRLRKSNIVSDIGVNKNGGMICRFF